MKLASLYSSFGWLLLLSVCFQACSPSTGRRIDSTVPKSGADKKGLSLVDSAQRYLGKSYKYGGNGPSSFDCSGLTHLVFKENRIAIPRTSSEQAKTGKSISISAVQTGDLLFFSRNKGSGPINHVALVTSTSSGKIWVIHSTTSKGVIKEEIVGSPYWNARLRSARRAH